ncbi:MAG: hypothetical protein KGL57_09800 [Burkholderiales bacterium]|nr:hypothetical protein [Burkholderiales bacterium]
MLRKNGKMVGWLAVGLMPALATFAVQAASKAEVPLAERIKAAQTTAQSASACQAAQPFYWEVGDARGVQASGQMGRDAPSAQTKMQIASASKWIYGAYVAEHRGGSLTQDDIRFLNFESGYTDFRMCRQGQTVQECQSSLLNRRGKQDPTTVGRFYYSGGHMQQHAVLMGLGRLDNDGLATAIKRELGPAGAAWDLSYSQPQLAGGGQSNAADYGRFLRAMLAGDLKMGALLGSHPVCANPKACASEAIKTPIPMTETWHYSVGHWVEDDPRVGDGAFSSPGAFGFYPWIDANRQFYGILAREEHKGILLGDVDSKPAVRSVDCGRLIRQAWESGRAP